MWFSDGEYVSYKAYTYSFVITEENFPNWKITNYILFTENLVDKYKEQNKLGRNK